LRSATAGSAYDDKQNFRVPVPMLGLGVKMGILANILEVRAKATGMAYSGSYYYDAMADIAVTPFPFFDIHGGFRTMKLKIDQVSDTYGNFDFTGPYIGAAINF
jgi:hypothetical protein